MHELEASVDPDLLQRRFDRERRARREAERLLEEKSREVFQANQELRELADRLEAQAIRTQAIVEHAAEGIVTIDSGGLIESMNPAAERIFGYAASELIGEVVQNIVVDKTHGEGHLPPCIVVSDGQSREVVGCRKDGSEFPLELTVSKVALGDQELYTGLLRDLSRRKQLEAQLAHAQKMESVGQLAAGIAHEINTPIQYVSDNARFLHDAFDDLDNLLQKVAELLAACQADGPPQDLIEQTRKAAEDADLEYLRDEVPQAIEQSIEGAERVATIVRAMKEFSHPGVAEKSAIDLNQAIESTVTISHNEWKYVANVETQFDTSLPLIPCHPGDLNQAILNLIVNAAHAIEKSRENDSQPLGTITVGTKLVGDYVEISVADTGTGIPEEVRPKIFDPFFTTKAVGKGTGQGLAIAYSVIAEKHEGTIEFETEIGVGTTFRVRLPIRGAA